tara:strand:- start:1619 stop:2299 length:681 start_codon:yes stop_codon:yes gene_type:complete
MRTNKEESPLKGGGPGTPRHAFTNKDSHPLVLNLLLVKEFGPDYLGWEPETCWVEIARTWKTTISEVNRNKIQAVRTCHTTDQPYERWEAFDLVASGLLGLPPKFDLIQKPTPHRAGLALDIMGQIKEGGKISSDVYKYVAACMMDYGMVYGTGPLEPCNEYLLDLLPEGSKKVQARVKVALDKNRKPKFDGNNEDDVHLMKSISVSDFLEGSSRILLIQLKRLLS